MSDEVCIVTFPTTHAALRAEKEAVRAGLAVRMVPVPRGISSDCNMGMEAPLEDMQRIRTVLTSRGIECELVKGRNAGAGGPL